jgi:MOSC domain-containing protein YiiM
MQPEVESIQVGRPQQFVAEGDSSRLWSSAIIKQVVTGRVLAGFHGMAWDEQSDRLHHGGPDKAVLAYASRHYSFWADRYPVSGFAPGAFGENLTISGIDESTCCLGDVYEIGGCLLEISQPRQPCWKLSMRWGISGLAKEVQDLRRTGWYMRVLREGLIEAGDTVELQARPHPDISVMWALDVMYAKPRSPGDDARLASLPALSLAWRTALQSRAASQQPASDGQRLSGESALQVDESDRKRESEGRPSDPGPKGGSPATAI